MKIFNKAFTVMFIFLFCVAVGIFFILSLDNNKNQKVKESLPTQDSNELDTNDLDNSQVDIGNIEEQNETIPKRNELLSKFISSYHEIFNEITNYDKYKNIDWDKFKITGNSIIEDINSILSNDVPSEMVIDLERIIQLIEIGILNQDEQAAVYIHRILHDLDIEYNQYAHSKFGFSNYDGGGANQQSVSNYIEEYNVLLND